MASRGRGAGGAPGSACIVLIDGVHSPPVTARAIAALRRSGERPVAALLAGGREKLGQVPLNLGLPVEVVADPEAGFAALIQRTGASRVVDLSDEPVLGYAARCRLASVALWCGATYTGADFCFCPPDRSRRVAAPSVTVIGTGKRMGKTAIAGAAARLWRDAGLNPVVVAMGRGGPPEPQVIEAGTRLDAAALLRFLEAGQHAASDYVEDALTARVATVGAWRAGGGLVGATAYSNVAASLSVAEALHPGIVVLEGSGAAIPPAGSDAGVLVASAGTDPGDLYGYFGSYRLLLADVVVLTMCEKSLGRGRVAAAERCARSRPLSPPKVVCTVFRPHPLGDVSGKKVWFATTAAEQAGPVLKRHLEGTYGCEVVAVSHALADRDILRRDLEMVPMTGVDALVVELKAAAVDVVTRWGTERGLEVIYVDNRPETVGGDGVLEELLMGTASLARERFGR